VQRPNKGFGALLFAPMVMRMRLVLLQKCKNRERAVGDGKALESASIVPVALWVDRWEGPNSNSESSCVKALSAEYRHHQQVRSRAAA
jgi:hypothetical protein